MARSEGVSERGSKWPVPKEASGLAFGTGVILRRLPKEVPSELRKGHPAGLRDGSEGFIGRGLREYVSLSEGSERVFRGGMSRRCFRRGLPGGSFGRASAVGGYDRWMQNGRLRSIG